MTGHEKVEFFFTPPATITTLGTFSSLFLLRREAQDCLIGKVIDEDTVIDEAMRGGEHRLFATMMVVMAGVDLLAKFYAGSDDFGAAGSRIKAFAARYMFPSAKDPARSAEILYQAVRNPLLHSFTLYDRKFEVWMVNRAPQFDIFENPEKPGHVLVSFEGIYSAFLRGLRAYHAELVGSPDLLRKFELMYEKYGTTGFGAMPGQ
jgi:hypothetical protein